MVLNDRPASSRPRARRGAALLLTLLVWATLTIVVAQMDVTSIVAMEQSVVGSHLRQCRRALDSVPGIAARMLTETGTDRAFDSLEDHWSLPKVFNFAFGENDEDNLTLTVSMTDVAARYDMKGMLDENLERAKSSAQDFIEFAAAFGLDSFAAEEIANSILNEAIQRRAEDQAVMDEIKAEGGTAMQPLPLWLDDFLNLPTVSDETRQAFRLAYAEQVDPASGQTVQYRLADELTSWRVGPPNVNTASLLVLMNSGSRLRNLAERIVEKRADEPYRNIAQLSIFAAQQQSQDQTEAEAPLTGADATVLSNRFVVKAEAKYRDQTARLRMIVERNAQGAVTILWRRSEP